MDLRSHSPYWLLKNGLPNTYPSLQQNCRTDIVVMGTGISGALTGWHLAKAGFSVIFLDKRHAAMGSTAASTALLQYEIDEPMHRLIELRGEKAAVRSYQYCAEAIETLEKICKRLGRANAFCRRPSLQYASFKSHVPQLEKEYHLRKKHGFRLAFLDAAGVEKTMGFAAPAALLSELGAEVDAYQLAHQLLADAVRMGATVYDNTEVTAMQATKNGVQLQTRSGYEVRCRELVIACGYESQQYIPQQIQTLHATYAALSEPLPAWEPWYQRCLIWETAQPYLYMRTTSDNRILVGGLDDDFYAPAKRDARIPAKTRRLVAAVQKKFPQLHFLPDFQWAGTFASTRDGLPYIGRIRQRPHTHFALGFGGNGITFSLIAAEMIRDHILGKKNPDQEIFSFNR